MLVIAILPVELLTLLDAIFGAVSFPYLSGWKVFSYRLTLVYLGFLGLIEMFLLEILLWLDSMRFTEV